MGERNGLLVFWILGFLCRIETSPCHSAYPNQKAVEMINELSHDAKTLLRFAQPPWNETSVEWRRLDARLPSNHLAREIRDAMPPLDLTPLYHTAGLGKAAYRPDMMLTMVLFELWRGRQRPSQWYQDTHENYVLWWLGFGICPSRRCWYEFRDHAEAYVDTLNARLLHQAVDEGMTTAERGALDGSAVAANASRRRLINEERLQKRLQQLEEAHHLEQEGPDDSQEALTEEVPSWMAETSQGRGSTTGSLRAGSVAVGGVAPR